MTNVRVLPADVFDAIELEALVYGGIGAGLFFKEIIRDDGGLNEHVPYCVWGMQSDLEETSTINIINPITEVAIALRSVGIGTGTNDSAVTKVNARRHRPVLNRISFKSWAEELNVVRGE